MKHWIIYLCSAEGIREAHVSAEACHLRANGSTAYPKPATLVLGPIEKKESRQTGVKYDFISEPTHEYNFNFVVGYKEVESPSPHLGKNEL